MDAKRLDSETKQRRIADATTSAISKAESQLEPKTKHMMIENVEITNELQRQIACDKDLRHRVETIEAENAVLKQRVRQAEEAEAQVAKILGMMKRKEKSGTSSFLPSPRGREHDFGMRSQCEEMIVKLRQQIQVSKQEADSNAKALTQAHDGLEEAKRTACIDELVRITLESFAEYSQRLGSKDDVTDNSEEAMSFLALVLSRSSQIKTKGY